MRAFIGSLTVAWVVSAGTLQAQDLTVFGGFQHPGTLTLRSGVDEVSRVVGVQSGTFPGDLPGFHIDPKDFGIFGMRLYRSAAPLGLEHTVAYSPSFIDSGGSAFLYSTNLRLELPRSALPRAGLGWLGESPPRRSHRLSPGGESRPPGASWSSTASPDRRPAPSPRGARPETRPADRKSGGRHRHA